MVQRQAVFLKIENIIPKAWEEENISLFKFRNKHEVFKVNTQNEATYFNPSYMLPEIVKNNKFTSCAQFEVEIKRFHVEKFCFYINWSAEAESKNAEVQQLALYNT